jgi:hypothetical protein
LAFIAATKAAEAARIVGAERVRRPILRGHQRKMHEIAAREHGAHGEPRKVLLGQVELGLGDLERLIHRLSRVQHNERGHELGDRGNGCRDVRIARVEDRGVALIDDQHRARLELGNQTRLGAGSGG